MLHLPIIITNFKTYAEATGKHALLLARVHEKIMKKYKVSLAIAVQAADVRMMTESVSVPVFAQHCDAISPGAHTGFILPEAIKEAGACGSLVNHYEHRIPLAEIREVVSRMRHLHLVSVVCAATPAIGKDLDHFGPDYIAVEPPELIGGDLSVSTAQPEIITHAVELIGETRTIVGAGVKTRQDVEIARKLGACGVLLASGVTRASDPEKVLAELAQGLL